MANPGKSSDKKEETVVSVNLVTSGLAGALAEVQKLQDAVAQLQRITSGLNEQLQRVSNEPTMIAEQEQAHQIRTSKK